MNSVQGTASRFWWSKLAGIAALAGFCTTVFIHVRTILHLPIPAEFSAGFPLPFPWFTGVMLVFAPMILDAGDGKLGRVSNSRLVAGMPARLRRLRRRALRDEMRQDSSLTISLIMAMTNAAPAVTAAIKMIHWRVLK